MGSTAFQCTGLGSCRPASLPNLEMDPVLRSACVNAEPRDKSVLMQVAMIFSKPFLLESRQPEEYQKMPSWDRKMQVRSGICPAVLSKWDRICEKMLRSSASQVRSGICPATLSKWDRVCKRMLCSHLRHRCEVASVLQRFPNGIVSARGCYAHVRHRSVTRSRCEVASALQCFPNGIVSARTCYALLRRGASVRSGICLAVLGSTSNVGSLAQLLRSDRTTYRPRRPGSSQVQRLPHSANVQKGPRARRHSMLLDQRVKVSLRPRGRLVIEESFRCPFPRYRQCARGSLLQEDAHVRPTRTSHCSRRRRAPSRHRSALLWNSATRATMDSGGPRSKISRGGGRKRSRSSRDVTLENMTYKWSHQLSSSNSGKRAQSTIVPVRSVKPCEAVLVKHWACVT